MAFRSPAGAIPAEGATDSPLSDSFSELKQAWPKETESARIKVKHFGVALLEDGTDRIATRTRFLALASGASEDVQQSAEWRCLWSRSASEGEPPELLQVTPVYLEEVRHSHSGRGSVLEDVTARQLGHLPAYRESLSHGANYWITRLPRLKHRFQHGIGVGDVDADGLEDVYLCQPEGLPNLLLSRTPGGAVREIAADHGLDFLDNTTSAIFADFDNDGDQDLAARIPLAIRSVRECRWKI